MTILAQDMETRYSAQLIIAALNEAPGIGLTIAEMKDTLGEISVLVEPYGRAARLYDS